MQLRRIQIHSVFFTLLISAALGSAHVYGNEGKMLYEGKNSANGTYCTQFPSLGLESRHPNMPSPHFGP